MISRARTATVEERRAHLIRMRVARIPYSQIVEELGYSSEPVARKDFTVACRAARALEVEAAEDRRYIEGLGYDLLETVYMPKALDGDQKSAELVLKIKAERRKLLGIDAPVQIEATITEVTQQDVAIRQLLAEAQAKNELKLAKIRERHELAKADRGGH